MSCQSETWSPHSGKIPTLNPTCVLPQDQRSDPKEKSDLGEISWINRRISLGAPTAENEMLQFSSGGHSRNDHIHFGFLQGSIRSAPLDSCMSTGSADSLPLLPKTFPVWIGPAKSREELPPPPQCSHSTPGHLPKSQPSCPTAAGVVSSLLFHHQVSKMIT